MLQINPKQGYVMISHKTGEPVLMTPAYDKMDFSIRFQYEILSQGRGEKTVRVQMGLPITVAEGGHNNQVAFDGTNKGIGFNNPYRGKFGNVQEPIGHAGELELTCRDGKLKASINGELKLECSRAAKFDVKSGFGFGTRMRGQATYRLRFLEVHGKLDAAWLKQALEKPENSTGATSADPKNPSPKEEKIQPAP